MAMPDWKEVKKDDVWKVMASRHHQVNFVWKPTNFNYRVCEIEYSNSGFHPGHLSN